LSRCLHQLKPIISESGEGKLAFTSSVEQKLAVLKVELARLRLSSIPVKTCELC
jgi:hypothetical protein